MIRSTYPPEFEQLWSAFDLKFGNKGSKLAAYKEFKKLNPDAELADMMYRKAIIQLVEKKEKRNRGQFVESFPHVERWIKKARWEDDIDGQLIDEHFGICEEQT